MKRKLSEIKINEEFSSTKPSNIKVQECRKFWAKNHKQDRYLVVNKDGYLIDGYIQYLILKENKVDEAEIQISNVRKNKWKRMEKIHIGISSLLIFMENILVMKRRKHISGEFQIVMDGMSLKIM